MLKGRRITIVLGTVLAFSAFISLFVGVIRVDLAGVFNQDIKQLEILFVSRFPRLCAILCAGAGLSVAGQLMQQLCRNKFVSPSTGSTVASAQFGILVAMIFFANATLAEKAVFSFLFAIAGTWIFVCFIQKIKFKNVVMVPLVGIMFGNIIAGATSYLSYRNGMNQALSSWLVGDFSMVVQGRYEIVFLVLPMIVLAFIFAGHFNIVGLGENFSSSLGVAYNRILFMGITIAALITASVVVTVGSISYVGLIVPNLIAMFKGDRLRNSLLDTALFGALFVLVCDMLGRVVIFPHELPIDLMVGIIGSFVFAMMLLRRLRPGNFQAKPPAAAGYFKRVRVIKPAVVNGNSLR